MPVVRLGYWIDDIHKGRMELMARSNIGRLLNARAEQEISKMGLELLDGVCHDIQTYHYYLGRANGLKWFLQQIDEIEGDKE